MIDLKQSLNHFSFESISNKKRSNYIPSITLLLLRHKPHCPHTDYQLSHFVLQYNVAKRSQCIIYQSTQILP